MLKILVTYAVQGEFVELKWPDIEPYYVRTGIGKVKSAFHLAEAIRQVQPDLVLNIGSAGTVNHQVGDIFVCRKFVDRDMQPIVSNRLAFPIKRSRNSARRKRLLHALDGTWNLQYRRWLPHRVDSR